MPFPEARMTVDTQSVAVRISAIVAGAPESTILGVRLGMALRATHPDFSPFLYQCRNLRHFIQRYVPSVAEKGHSGADVVYTTVANGAIAPNPQNVSSKITSIASDFVALPVSPDQWKAYSNPGHHFTLLANKETGEIRVQRESEPSALPWAIVPKPSSEFHRILAREFIESLPQQIANSLTKVLGDPKWYVFFSAFTRKAGVGLQWAAFRRKKLIEALKQALSDLGIPPVPSFPTPKGVPVTVGMEPKHLRSDGGGEDAALRDVIQKVVSELPISELRSLRLPVGVVFDLLRR
jgi:hypothetical protein